MNKSFITSGPGMLDLKIFTGSKFSRNLTSQFYCKIVPRRDITCLQGLADNTGADQPAYPHRLITQGGGGCLIFSSYVGSGQTSTVHPPKISGISSTSNKYLIFDILATPKNILLSLP